MAILDAVDVGPLQLGDEYEYTYPDRGGPPDLVVALTATDIRVVTATATATLFQMFAQEGAESASFVLIWFGNTATRKTGFLPLGWNGRAPA